VSRARFPMGALGLLSPLSPSSPLNPLNARSLARHPPKLVLGRDHDSILAKLYGRNELQRIPFPNMEWWWNSMLFRAKTSTPGDLGDLFSVISDVQLYTLPGDQSLAEGTLSIRNLSKGRRFQVQTSGTLDPGRSCRFSANGWHIWRTSDEDESALDEGVYQIEVFAPDLQVKLELTQGKVAELGDAGPGFLGWTDNNPRGVIPYWVTYRSRFGKVSGTLRLPDEKKELTVTGAADTLENQVRFDHQSVHWSTRDVGGLSLQVLGEAAITRPAWLWYHMRFQLRSKKTGSVDVLNFVAYELRNGHTGSKLKQFAALTDDSGKVTSIDPEQLTFEESRQRIPGRVSAPRRTTIEFVSSTGLRGKLKFTCEEGQDFTVSYPIAGALAFEAQEAIGHVEGTVQTADEELTLEGRGTLEVLDFLKSLTF